MTHQRRAIACACGPAGDSAEWNARATLIPAAKMHKFRQPPALPPHPPIGAHHEN